MTKQPVHLSDILLQLATLSPQFCYNQKKDDLKATLEYQLINLL